MERETGIEPRHSAWEDGYQLKGNYRFNSQKGERADPYGTKCGLPDFLYQSLLA
jgi:hypothetical protein